VAILLAGSGIGHKRAQGSQKEEERIGLRAKPALCILLILSSILRLRGKPVLCLPTARPPTSGIPHAKADLAKSFSAESFGTDGKTRQEMILLSMILPSHIGKALGVCPSAKDISADVFSVSLERRRHGAAEEDPCHSPKKRQRCRSLSGKSRSAAVVPVSPHSGAPTVVTTGCSRRRDRPQRRGFNLRVCPRLSTAKS
jgi:hypothetical protein